VWDPHLAYRKTGLGHISTFVGPTMCTFGVFARKDGASRLIDIPKITPTRFIPPLVIFTRVFLGVVSAKGSQKYPQATPTKITPGSQHWLIIQCWPYSMSRRALKFLNAVRSCV
jgi:hypothetical protein